MSELNFVDSDFLDDEDPDEISQEDMCNDPDETSYTQNENGNEKEKRNSVPSFRQEHPRNLFQTGSKTFEFVVTFENEIFPIALPKTATVRDLKEAIFKATRVRPEQQQVDGFNIAWSDLENEMPLFVLGITSSHPLLLRKCQPVLEDPTSCQLFPHLTVPPKDRIQDDHNITMPLSVRPHKLREYFGEKQYNIDEYAILWDMCAVDADAFTGKFESDFGTTHPIFIGGLYSDTAKCIKETFQFLVVNLHGDNQCYPENFVFCKETLTSEVLAQYLAENFLFWVGHVDVQKELEFESLFGYPVRFPFIAVIAYIDNALKIVELHEGRIITAEELMSRLFQITEVYEPILQRNKEKTLERKMKQLIIDEQNAEYQKSLERDRERAKQKQEVERAKEAKISRAKTIIRQARLQAIQRLEKLPDPPPPGEKSADIQICLPNGARLQRKFSPSHTLQVVADFIEGRVAQLLEDTTFVADSTPSLEADNVTPWSIRSYELVRNFPKRKFSSEDFNKTLSELGLVPQSLLFLQEKFHSSNI